MGLSDEHKALIKLIFEVLNEKGIRWPKTEEWDETKGGKKKKMMEIYGVLQARDYDEQAAVGAMLDKFGREKWALDAKSKEETDNADDEEEDDSGSKRKREDAEEKTEDFSTLSVKELKSRLEALEQDISDCLEKSDLVKKLQFATELVNSHKAATKSEHNNENGSTSPVKKSRKKKEPSSPVAKKSETFVVEENRALGEALKEMADLYFAASERMKGGVYSKAAKIVSEVDHHLDCGKTAMKEKGIGKGIGAFLDELNEKGFVEKLEKMRSGDI
jgi:hypothetical protein